MKRPAAVLAALVAVAATILPVVAEPAPAPAAAATASEILASFNPGDIMSDEVMFNSGTMTASAVQTFLNGQVPTCRVGYTCLKDYQQDTVSRAADPMCGAYAGAAAESAATIIVKVANACRVNPQVLLVVLQKEQSLVTDTWPSADQYRKATGYACPDTAPCDAEYNGFFNQVYKAAWALVRYTMPPGTGTGTSYYTNYGAMYAVGRTSALLYNPDTSCGSKLVTIANQATHALYVYTPYTPNAGALAAGWGTATCGAYGNRNFYLYFTSWFGSTHYTVAGAIKTAWTAAGGASGVLGNPTGNAVTSTANGGGTYQVFQHGRIYSSAAGAFALTGLISSRYAALKGPASALKWPTAAGTASTANGGGSLQAFQGGVLASPTGATTAYPVTDAVFAEYAGRGGQDGSVGWPTGDAAAVPGGAAQPFSGGVILQKTGDAKAHAVLGQLLTAYTANGGTSGPLGWPAAGWRGTTASGGGSSQAFEHGALYRSAEGAYAVTGALATAYASSGGPGGVLSWPTAGGLTSGAGTKQSFVNGSLYQPTGKDVLPVTSPFITEYLRVGADGGPLGWPTAAKGALADGAVTAASVPATAASVQPFQKGAIYGVPLGNFSVAGAIYSGYLARRGPSGRMGLPMREQWTHRANGGGFSQKFSGGYLFASKAGTWGVGGRMLPLYLKYGGVGGVLKWPTAEGKAISTAANGSGSVQTFQSGSIYRGPKGTYAVRGAFLTAYVAKGGPTGRLGWPTTTPRLVSGVMTQWFQHGRITWTSAAGAAVRY